MSLPNDTIPPERQSTRLRQRHVPNAAAASQNTTTQSMSTKLPERNKRFTHSTSAPKSAATAPQQDQDENVDEDFDEEAESEDDDSMFKPRVSLPESSVQRWNLAEIVQKIDDKLIDLDPEYQRDVVWIPKAMSGLINSLIEDFYVPPLIFNLQMTKRPDGRHQYLRVCVDGKQRLSSVHAFMKGRLPCYDKHGKTWYYCQELDESGKPTSSGTKRRVWTDGDRLNFRNKSFVSYEFKNLDRVQEEDLFARVQKGQPLTAPEKLRASSGPWQNLAKEFETRYSSVVGLSKLARGVGFRNVLTAFTQILEVQNPSNANGTSKTRIQMPAVTALVNKHPELCGAANKKHLEDVFSKFAELVSISRKTFENNNYKVARNFAPVEMVAVAVLISLYMGTRNNTMLLGDIETMREVVREHLPDLRMDNTTWKTIWQFIDELESFRGASNGSTARKKNFTPTSTTTTDMARIKAGGVTARQPLHKNSNAGTAPGRPSSSSNHASARSTPAVNRDTPATSISSPESTTHRELPTTGREAPAERQRSASIDSMLGDLRETRDEDWTPTATQHDAQAQVPPTVPMLEPPSSTMPKPPRAEPVVKFEADSGPGLMANKRPLSMSGSGSETNFNARIEAQRAKRVKLPSRNS